MTPRDHISAALPEYVAPAFNISGLTYAGQPLLSCNQSLSGSSNTTASSSDSNLSSVLEKRKKTLLLESFHATVLCEGNLIINYWRLGILRQILEIPHHSNGEFSQQADYQINLPVIPCPPSESRDYGGSNLGDPSRDEMGCMSLVS